MLWDLSRRSGCQSPLSKPRRTEVASAKPACGRNHGGSRWQLEAKQPARVALVNFLPIFLGDIQNVQAANRLAEVAGAFFRIKGPAGGKWSVVDTKKIQAAFNGGS